MKLDRYLASQLFAGTLLALLALLALLTLVDFVDEVGDVDAVYTLMNVAHYVWLTTPERVYELLPVAMLIGGLLSLGNLAAQSELVALRAAGYSRKRIIASALGVGCLFAAATALIGETLVPSSQAAAARVQDGGRDVERSGLFQKTDLGIWSREGRRFIHARAAGENGEYFGASIYEFGDGGRLERVVNGASLRVESDYFVLYDVRDARIGGERVRISEAARVTLPRDVTLDAGMLGAIAPSVMNVPDLIRHIGFLKRSSLRRDFHELELWSRISRPLSTLVMLLLALPFVFAPVRSSTGQRLFYGILIGLAYTLISNIFGSAAIAWGFSPMLGAFAPLLLGFAFGAYHLAVYR